MKKHILLFGLILIGFLSWIALNAQFPLSPLHESEPVQPTPPHFENEGGLIHQSHPLSVESMRHQEYPGSEIVVEQELNPGSNYTQSVVSYRSDGLKIFALLTVPIGEPPDGGWPAIVFNHGYIPPQQYRTTQRYVKYVGTFARDGYIVLKPDYRGHGNSEGSASGGYGSPNYTIDVLNAFSSLEKHPAVNPERIGMWGHSMGGAIVLRSMVVNPKIKSGVIWAGVVGSYPELMANWRRGDRTPNPSANTQRGRWRQTLIEEYGSPEENPAFWNEISPTFYVTDVSGPIQLHHATGDTSVPHEFSESLHQRLQSAGKPTELFIYEGDNHNLSQNFSLAMQRSLQFFNQHL